MAWEDTILYVHTLHDICDWGGTEVTVIAGQHTMKQSRIDLANTHEYRGAHILCRLVAVEGRAQILALENTKPATPQGRGWGCTRRVNYYYAQRVVGTPALEPVLNALSPGTLEDYHSAREPSEFEYESERSEGPSSDSTGYSSMTTVASHHYTDHTQRSDTKNCDQKCRKQKHHDRQNAGRQILRRRETGGVAGLYCPCSGNPPSREP